MKTKSRLSAEKWAHRKGPRERREVKTFPPAFQHKEAGVQDSLFESQLHQDIWDIQVLLQTAPTFTSLNWEYLHCWDFA